MRGYFGQLNIINNNMKYIILIDKFWLGAYLVIYKRKKYKKIELHYKFY